MSLCTTTLELPQDVIEDIILFFGPFDNANKSILSPLALVNQCFLPVCHKFLFQTIVLDHSCPLSHLYLYIPCVSGVDIIGPLLYKCLETSPHLYSYIHTLKMATWTEDEDNWMISNISASIICGCTKLCALKILVSETNKGFPWSDITLSIQSALSSLFMSCQLSHLAIRNINKLPWKILCSFGSLTTLWLQSDISCEPVPENDNTLPYAVSLSTRPCLKSLTISMVNETLQSVLNLIHPQLD